MNASEIRLNARKALKGKWGKAVLMTLIYLVFIFVIYFIVTRITSVSSIIGLLLSLIFLLLSIPWEYSFTISFVNLKRSENVGYFNFIREGFNNISKSWSIILWKLIKCIVPIVLMIIALILMIYSYSNSLANVQHSTSSSSFYISYTSSSPVGTISMFLLMGSIIWLICKMYLYSLSYYISNDS